MLVLSDARRAHRAGRTCITKAQHKHMLKKMLHEHRMPYLGYFAVTMKPVHHLKGSTQLFGLGSTLNSSTCSPLCTGNAFIRASRRWLGLFCSRLGEQTITIVRVRRLCLNLWRKIIFQRLRCQGSMHITSSFWL